MALTQGKVNLAHDPEKLVLDLIGGWVPVFGEDHAPAMKTHVNHELASMSSSLRCPGTMATGIGKVPALLARLVTSGPGPSLAVPAASTRMPMSVSSSISLTISVTGSPSRITRSGTMSAISLARAANLLNAALAASVAS